jgi:hypothetical protein
MEKSHTKVAKVTMGFRDEFGNHESMKGEF